VRRKPILASFRTLLLDKDSKAKNKVKENTLPCPHKLYNKLEGNWHLSNKKALFLNMRNYYESINEDPFDYLPVTFHVKTGVNDPEF
jgi:hypothetical protein